VLFLPPLLAALLASVSIGQVITARHLAGHAADLGALAGVQELDLDALARGELVLIPAEARSRATEYARANLHRMFPELDPGPEVYAEVLNPTEGGSIDPLTGRVHLWPTVCVTVVLSVPVGIGPLSAEIPVRAHADASAVPR
jgi:Flp pilus assembly protein TadG